MPETSKSHTPGKKFPSDARMTAFRILMRVEKDGGYSNIALSEALDRSGLEPRDRAFVTRLVYGVLEKYEYIDYVISSYVRTGASLETDVRCILQMAVYQMVFMDTPDSAAVNESVNLAKKLRLFRATGLINGLLRSFVRDGKKVNLPDPSAGQDRYLSVKYSCPEWLVRMWRESYGEEICKGIISHPAENSFVYVRVNSTLTTAGRLVADLLSGGVRAEECPGVPDCVRMGAPGGLRGIPAYADGLFHVQGIASQLCCAAASPKRGETVVDVCAAPGGKSFTMAEMMEGEGRVISCDCHRHRVDLIREGAARLRLTCVEPLVRDALTDRWDETEFADLVLCDVPCSGLGVLAGKPDVRFKSPESIAELPETQYRILDHSSALVRKGGRLVYSTCTLNPAENGDVIARFLANHSEFEPLPVVLPEGVVRAWDEPDYTLTLFPHISRTDGFFISSVRRKE